MHVFIFYKCLNILHFLKNKVWFEVRYFLFTQKYKIEILLFLTHFLKEKCKDRYEYEVEVFTWSKFYNFNSIVNKCLGFNHKVVSSNIVYLPGGFVQ